MNVLPLPVPPGERRAHPVLQLNNELLVPWLGRFIKDNLRHRGFERVVVGMSGGVDSSAAAALAVNALGAENVTGVMMPFEESSPESLQHAALVGANLGIEMRTVEITPMVHGYIAQVPSITPHRRGNLMARLRTMTLFDMSEELFALPLGTSNKTERMLGYFTWHGDDALPLHPLADLLKTQVWDLASHLDIPEVIVNKPASADLVQGQTDEGDFGFTYAVADLALHYLLNGYTDAQMAERGLDPQEVARVRARVDATHWKRHLPAMAMVSDTAINDFYLRPLDF
ncbi:MAG: NAD+ synthase [Candidatus Dormibacteria bacterium]